MNEAGCTFPRFDAVFFFFFLFRFHDVYLFTRAEASLFFVFPITCIAYRFFFVMGNINRVKYASRAMYLSRGSTDELNSVPGLSMYVIWYYTVQGPNLQLQLLFQPRRWLILTAAKITLVLAGPSCYKFPASFKLHMILSYRLALAGLAPSLLWALSQFKKDTIR